MASLARERTTIELTRKSCPGLAVLPAACLQHREDILFNDKLVLDHWPEQSSCVQRIFCLGLFGLLLGYFHFSLNTTLCDLDETASQRRAGR